MVQLGMHIIQMSIDSYNISGEVKDALNGNLKTLITSNGGVIDIYHYSPNKTYADITRTIEELKYFRKRVNEVWKINKFTEYI